MNNATKRMMGSGIPINQSKAPLPKPMTLSSFSSGYVINLGMTKKFQAKNLENKSKHQVPNEASW
jgi:hypothetical protein